MLSLKHYTESMNPTKTGDGLRCLAYTEADPGCVVRGA
jgi:hypothetical protein